MASTGRPMAAGLTPAMGKMAPFLMSRSTRLRTVGSDTPMLRAMLAYERRELGRSRPMMRRSSSSMSMLPNGAWPKRIMCAPSARRSCGTDDNTL